MKERGKVVGEEAASLLAAHTGSALRLVNTEIEKLLTYVGERESITVDDVAAVVGVSRDSTVFELIHAVANRDLRRSMVILESMITEGQSGPFIVSMLTGQFATVWKALALQHESPRGRLTPKDLAAQIPLRPIAAQDAVHFLEQYSPLQIEDAFDILVEADELLKSSSLDDRAILESMLVRLVGAGPVTQDHAV
jgi:DNA polymerase-3 subunit delta